jgi:hypothetical protein
MSLSHSQMTKQVRLVRHPVPGWLTTLNTLGDVMQKQWDFTWGTCPGRDLQVKRQSDPPRAWLSCVLPETEGAVPAGKFSIPQFQNSPADTHHI